MMKSAGIIIIIWVSLLYGKMKILYVVKFKWFLKKDISALKDVTFQDNLF